MRVAVVVAIILSGISLGLVTWQITSSSSGVGDASRRLIIQDEEDVGELWRKVYRLEQERNREAFDRQFSFPNR